MNVAGLRETDAGNRANEFEILLHETLRTAERERRSAFANVATTAFAIFLASAAFLPGGAYIFGRGTPTTVAVVVGAWIVFEAATGSFYLLGPDHRFYRFLALLDGFCQHAALLALIYLSGSAASPLWFLSMVKAFATPAGLSLGRRSQKVFDISIVVAQCTLIAAFVYAQKIADAMILLLVLFSYLAVQRMNARQSLRALQLRAERELLTRTLHRATVSEDRDRIARELHDGVGADVMALLLRLRRGAQPDDPEERERQRLLVARAQAILDELRSVVWSLRNEQGTLAELGKLIDAAARSALPATLTYVRSTPIEQAQIAIDPGGALAALAGARELLQAAAGVAGVTSLRVVLAVESSNRVLTLAVCGAADGVLGEESRRQIPLESFPSSDD